jgi:endonuclease/exonuclease/phosphatase family metal-dependent hydrolase
MRLVTYNIHKGIGGSDRRYRFERVLAVLAELAPDLVCLQEVDCNVERSHFHNQPMLLCRHLEAAAHRYQLNVPHRNGGGYGNLILSRWPIQAHYDVSLRAGRRKPRGAQLVVVATPQGPLHLVNLHLGLAEKERRWQISHLLHHPLFLASAHLPTLIAGDYNDWRNTLCKQRFAAHDFLDATSPARRFRSFPAFMPVAALDKVFYRGSIALHFVHVFRSRLARRASDHLPLLLDFQLQP